MESILKTAFALPACLIAIGPGNSAKLADFMRIDRERWGKAFRASGFKPMTR